MFFQHTTKELAAVDKKYNSLLHRYEALSEINMQLSSSAKTSTIGSTLESLEASTSLKILQLQFAEVCEEKVNLRINLKNAESEQCDLLDSIQGLLREKETIKVDFEDIKNKYDILNEAYNELRMKFH